MCKTTGKSILLRDGSKLVSKVLDDGTKTLVKVLADGTNLPVKVHESDGGFYIGAWDHEGPYSRESADYYKTHEQAQEALNKRTWRLRESVSGPKS